MITELTITQEDGKFHLDFGDVATFADDMHGREVLAHLMDAMISKGCQFWSPSRAQYVMHPDAVL